MNVTIGDVLSGPAGTAEQVLYTMSASDPPDWSATIGVWFLTCPGQSPAWRHYLLSMIHLRPIDGVKPAVIRDPAATHEVLLFACDPSKSPQPTDPTTWARLTPVNLMEQVEVPSDDDAADLLRACALAVVNGVLWAEPPLSHQVEPWRSTLRDTAGHYRGEHTA